MTTTAPSVAPPAAAPITKTDVTSGAPATENPFHSTLKDALKSGPGDKPEAGQAANPPATDAEKPGHDVPVDGKDLPLALTPEPGTGLDASVEAALAMIVPANMGKLAPSASTSDQAPSETDTDGLASLKAGQVSLLLPTKLQSSGSHGATAVTTKNEASFNVSNNFSADPTGAMVDNLMQARTTTEAMNTASAVAPPGIPESASVVPNLSHAPVELMSLFQESGPRSAQPAAAIIAAPFNQPGWDQALGDRVQWLVTQRMQSAELHLNPPELGPVEIRLSLNQDQARIHFTSPHALVREAIEAALPRLRETLGESGIQLANADVGQYSPERQAFMNSGSGGSQHAAPSPFLQTQDGDNAVPITSAMPLSALGLVDYYA